jgi:hypothetical protein
VVLRHGVQRFFEVLFSDPAFPPHDLTPGQVLAGEALRHRLCRALPTVPGISASTSA